MPAVSVWKSHNVDAAEIWRSRVDSGSLPPPLVLTWVLALSLSCTKKWDPMNMWSKDQFAKDGRGELLRGCIIYRVLQSDLSIPSWRSLNLSMGHLTIPKRSQRLARWWWLIRSLVFEWLPIDTPIAPNSFRERSSFTSTIIIAQAFWVSCESLWKKQFYYHNIVFHQHYVFNPHFLMISLGPFSNNLSRIPTQQPVMFQVDPAEPKFRELELESWY